MKPLHPRPGSRVVFPLLLLSWFLQAASVLAQGGAVDPGFQPGPGFTGANRLALQADGKIYVGGPFKSYGSVTVSGLLRLNADGTPDAGFNLGAGVEGPLGGAVPPTIWSMVPTARGLLVGGTFEKVHGVARTNMVRILADGAVDAGFLVRPDNPVLAVTVQADGKILIGGGFKNVNGQPRNAVARLNVDGSLDTGFNPSWGSIVGPSARVIVVQPDGKILVGGGHLSLAGGLGVKGVARLNTDGSLDSGFNLPAFTGLIDSVGSLVLQSDGKMVIAGTFGAVSGTARKGLARLNADGTLDAAWGGAGAGSGGAESVNVVAAAAGGKLYVGGGFSTLNGAGPAGIQRLNADGTRDADFNKPAGSTSFAVSDLVVQPDGKVVVVGGFTLGSTLDSVKSVLRLVGAGTVAPPPPTITSSPGDVAAPLNTVNVQLNVFASGTPPLAYQWYKDGAALNLKQDPSLLISQLRASDVGNYWVVVSNAGGSVTSSVARISLLEPVQITRQPEASTVAPGAPASFSVVASGTAPIRYQWRKDGIDIPGATAATFTLASAAFSDEGSYSVVVSNDVGMQTSASVRLMVSTGGPRITRQPQGQALDLVDTNLTAQVLAGRRLRLTVAGGLAPWIPSGTYEIEFSASGYSSPAGGALATASAGTYAVRQGTAPVATLVDFANFFPGGQAAVLTLVPGGIFEFNRDGLVEDQNGHWELVPAYVPPAAPGLLLSVEATGSGALTYQWSRDGAPIPGATAASLNLDPVTRADLGNYTVAVTDGVGTTVSTPARVSLLSEEPTGPVPATYEELVNRLFVRVAPNGVPQAFQLLPGGDFAIPTGNGYRTNRVTYSREGLAANQGRLTFVSTDVFSGRLTEQRYDFLLVFGTSRSGLYDLGFTVTGVTGVQQFSGPFEFSVGTNIAPRIAVQPTGGTVPAGTNLRLSVVAIGLELSYQWTRNGVPIPGATESSLQPGPLSNDLVGAYAVTVSNPLGSVVSAVANLDMATTPVITRQPSPVQVYEGDAFRLTVAATGGGLLYEWLRNGQPVFRVDPSPDYLVTSATAQHAGTYTVRVSNQAGSVVSEPVAVTVCTPGLDHTWQERSWVRVLGSGDPVPGSARTFGPLADPFHPLFTVRNQTVHVVARGDDDAAKAPDVHRGLFRWRDGTLQTLVFTNTPRPGGGKFDDVFYPTDEEGGVVHFASGSMYSLGTGGVTEFLPTTTPAPGRAPLTLIGTGSYARRGAAVAISSSVGTLEPFRPVGAGVYLHDGVSLVRIADDTTDLPGVMAGYGGRPSEDAINFDGETVVFSTIDPMAGTAGVYKATRSGVITKLADTGDTFPGSTGRYVGFTDVDVEGGWVFAVAHDGVGRPNRVIVFDGTGPGRVVGLGDYLVAGGPRQVWFGNAVGIFRWTDGVTEQVITSGAILDCRSVAGFFDVEAHGEDVAIGVSFQDGSRGVYLNLGAPTTGAPRILVQPESLSVPTTFPATFSVTATGAGPLHYQWRHDGNPIPGATGAVLTLMSTSVADAGSYDVLVSNGAGSATSARATLALTEAPPVPVIQVQPQPVTVSVGGAAVLSASVSGARPMVFQWRHASTNLPGATSPVLELAQLTPAQHGVYDLLVSNAAGSITSRVALVSVTPVITTQPLPASVQVGGAVSFTVAATGYPAYRYLWLKDGTAIPRSTNATLTLPAVTVGDAGIYAVNVTGIGGGTVRSMGVPLTVNGGETPGTPAVLALPRLDGGQLQFQLPTVAGRTYDIEFRTGLGNGGWTTLQTVVGDGSTRPVGVPTIGTSGFVRVATRP